MKKLVVAGIALLVVSAGAFAAVRIGVYGVCPLTGRPLHHAAALRAPASDRPVADERGQASGAAANASADAFAAPQAAAESSSPCAQKRRHCCDAEAKAECCKPAAAPAPATEPSTRP